MKTKRLLLLSLTLCFLLAQTGVAQPTSASPPNADPERVRGIVQALAALPYGDAAILRGVHTARAAGRTSALSPTLSCVSVELNRRLETAVSV